MIRVFIGYDATESLAYHVLAHSIISRASEPVSITPVRRSLLGAHFWRKRDDSESTDFSLSRFIIPALCDYSGYGIFMDCDMLCLTDIAELWEERDPSVAIHCVKHDYTPSTDIKMLGARQSNYPCKNWSSMMLMNFSRCRELTPAYVNNAPASELHQFDWVGDQEIAGLPLEWNWLVGEYANTHQNLKMLHWTLGGPWWPQYEDAPFSDLWRAWFANMLDEWSVQEVQDEVANAAQRYH
jgi:hypothetical protein